MATMAASAERRLFQRTRALRGGSIVFNRASSTISCSMTNHSDGGAKLDVASPLGIPATFELKLPGQPGRRLCEVIWRRGNALGVQFTSF